jgi:hypothetical protein
MRESAQFAGVVRSVLRFRILKRVQEEMTREELMKKKALLESLERSEMEARRIERHLSTNSASSPAKEPPSRSSGGQSPGNSGNEDTASIDSDFPPTHGETPAASPSATQGAPQRSDHADQNSDLRKRSMSGNFVASKIFGRLSHAMHGIVDVDPERTRRDQIGKTKESLAQVNTASPQEAMQ